MVSILVENEIDLEFGVSLVDGIELDEWRSGANAGCQRQQKSNGLPRHMNLYFIR